MKKITKNLKFVVPCFVFMAAFLLSQSAFASVSYTSFSIPYDVVDSYNIVTCKTLTHGQIDPTDPQNVPSGSGPYQYTITPDSGYAINDVTVDGASQGAITSYTFDNVTSDHTICATFKAGVTSYTITATSGPNGSIAPSGATTVAAHGSLAYTITPNTNYSINDVTVDGVSQGAIASYTFTNVTADHTINSTFSSTSSAPDLTATNIGPSTVSASQQTNLTADIQNIGTGSTGGSFNNFFQINTQPDGSGSTVDLGSVPSPMSALAAGSTQQAQSTAYIFGASGTYYVRACANKSSSATSLPPGTGTFTESNWNNNCSGWTAVTVSNGCGGAGCPPPTCGTAGQPPCDGGGGPVNGLCNNSVTYGCSAGSATSESAGPPTWTWSCQGSGGGTTDNSCHSSVAPSGGDHTCNDHSDNDHKNGIDTIDPSCHTDCNAKNDSSYDPTMTEGLKKCLKPIYIEH